MPSKPNQSHNISIDDPAQISALTEEEKQEIKDPKPDSQDPIESPPTEKYEELIVIHENLCDKPEFYEKYGLKDKLS